MRHGAPYRKLRRTLMTRSTQKYSRSVFSAATRYAVLMLCLVVMGAGAAHAQTLAYVTNSNDSTVPVINTTTHTVTANVPVSSAPAGIAVTPNGARAYVASFATTNVSVIDTASNTVIATVSLPSTSFGVAITPDGAFAYVANGDGVSGQVSVIDTSTNTVT